MLKRRRFVGSLLALAALGIFPGGCGERWTLLAPRRVPWRMKPLSSAKTEETLLADGRVRLRIEHDLLRGVSPPMLVWWWRHIEGDMEIEGNVYPRYMVWHPIDHIHFELVRRLPDGSVGPGAIFHIVEALGAELKNLIDVRLHLEELEETGARVEVQALGQTVAEIRGEFVPREAGTQMLSVMTIGAGGWLARTGLNSLLIERYFPTERRRAWLKHSVEEIGNFEFFLPGLYRRSLAS